MRQMTLAIMLMLSASSCQMFKAINSSKNGKFVVASDTATRVINLLAHYRKTGVIAKKADWDKIKVAIKSTTMAFKLWEAGIDDKKDNIEALKKVALEGLTQLQAYNAEYKPED